MTQTDEAVAEAIKSIASQANRRIAESDKEARAPFAQASRSTPSMHKAVNKAAAMELNAIARDMVDKIREYEPSNPAHYAAVIEAALRPIGETVLRDRKENMGRRLQDIDILQKFSNQLQDDVNRAIDDAIRDLKYQKLQHTTGNTYIAIRDVNAPLTMAVGQNNQAQQTIVSDQFAGLRDALAAFREATADPSVSQELRLGVIDQVDVIEAELAKPQPDEGKVKRLSKWFADKCTGPAFGAAIGHLITWLAS